MSDINAQIIKYVDKNDVEKVKATLTGLAYVGDPESFLEFKSSTEYAVRRINELFDLDDGQELNMEYSLAGYKKIAKLMMNNFSEKKYKAVVEIGLKVFEQKSSLDDVTEKEGNDENPFTDALKNPVKITIVLILVIAIVVLILKMI